MMEGEVDETRERDFEVTPLDVGNRVSLQRQYLPHVL